MQWQLRTGHTMTTYLTSWGTVHAKWFCTAWIGWGKVASSKMKIFKQNTLMEDSKLLVHLEKYTKWTLKKRRVPSCTCLDWMRFHIPCKHFFAIFSNERDWSWYSLPPTYLASPLLCSDQEALCMGAFPNPNDTVEAGPFDLLAETQEKVSQQSCKQPQNGLPEKQVTNLS